MHHLVEEHLCEEVRVRVRGRVRVRVRVRGRVHWEDLTASGS